MLAKALTKQFVQPVHLKSISLLQYKAMELYVRMCKNSTKA